MGLVVADAAARAVEFVGLPEAPAQPGPRRRSTWPPRRSRTGSSSALGRAQRRRQGGPAAARCRCTCATPSLPERGQARPRRRLRVPSRRPQGLGRAGVPARGRGRAGLLRRAGHRIAARPGGDRPVGCPTGMESSELRRVWNDFCVERGHTLVPSASLIPTHPTAPMFTNSGMMQFVPYFIGEEKVPYDPPRAASIQKAVRIGGKHNDLDVIGRSIRHLSFFEMLGQLELRRLLQGRRHPLGMGAGHRAAGPRPRPAVGHGPHQRRRGGRDLAGRGRVPGREDPPVRPRQLLGDGRDRPVRSVLGDLPRPGRRLRTRRRPGEPRRRGPIRRVLEPGVHAVLPPGRRIAQRSADQERRHRSRLRAHAHAAQRLRQPVRDRRCWRPSSTPSSRCPASGSARTTRPRWRCGWSPITPAR